MNLTLMFVIGVLICLAIKAIGAIVLKWLDADFPAFSYDFFNYAEPQVVTIDPQSDFHRQGIECQNCTCVNPDTANYCRRCGAAFRGN